MTSERKPLIIQIGETRYSLEKEFHDFVYATAVRLPDGGFCLRASREPIRIGEAMQNEIRLEDGLVFSIGDLSCSCYEKDSAPEISGERGEESPILPRNTTWEEDRKLINALKPLRVAK